MASGGEHEAAAAAAGEQTPVKSAAEGADTELHAPSGWTKKLNPTRGGKFEVVFVAPTGEEIKTKRALTTYLKKNPGGPALSEFVWATGNTPRRSSRLSGKSKATESPEDKRPPKRGRLSNSKRGKKGKQEDAEDAQAESGDHDDAEEAKDTEVEMKDAEEGKGTDLEMEMKEAEDTQEDKKEDGGSSVGEKKEVDTVAQEEKEDATEKTEEVEGSELPEVTEEAEGKAAVVELPGDVSAPVSENKENDKPAESEVAAAEVEMSDPVSEDKENQEPAESETVPVEFEMFDPVSENKENEEPAESEVVPVEFEMPAPEAENKEEEKPVEYEAAPVEGEKSENGLTFESIVPPPADSTINPATPPPAEIKADAPSAEAAKGTENSADNTAHKDGQENAVPEEQAAADNNGQIHQGASTVKCT